MKCIFALFVFFMISSSALADKVVCSQRVVNGITDEAVLASISDAAYYYINKFQNINNNTIDFWVTSLVTANGRKELNGAFSKIGYTKELWSYNYKNNKYTTLVSVFYSCNGDVIYSKTYQNYEIEWTYIVPDSVSEGVTQKAIEILKNANEQQ